MTTKKSKQLAENLSQVQCDKMCDGWGMQREGGRADVKEGEGEGVTEMQRLDGMGWM